MASMPDPAASPAPYAPSEPIAHVLARGFAAHQAGRLAEATECYEYVLAHMPDEPHALRLLGEIAQRTGNPERAIELTRRSLKRNPGSAEAHNNLGTAYRTLGRLDEAEDSFRRAIALNPALAITHNNLGAMLIAKGQIKDARDILAKVVVIEPESADTWLNLGVAEHRAGDLAAAERAFRRAAELAPENAGAWNNLAAVLITLKRPREALVATDRAAALSPNSHEIHNNRGNIMRALGRFDDAAACYCRALELKPDFADAHSNLGILLSEQRQPVQAAVHFRKAIDLDPGSTAAMSNLATVLHKLRKLSEALAWLDHALEINPHDATSYGNRGMVLVAMGRIEEALQQLRRSMELKKDADRVYSNYLFTLNYAPGVSRDMLFAEHCGFDAQFGDHPPPVFANARDPAKQLRVAYVSGDFRTHPCASFIEPLLANHDPAQVEIFCYSTYQEVDDYTRRFKALAHHWRDASVMMDEDLQAAMLADGIDIAVDLAGHTGGGRLTAFARRLAPVQVTWLGYPATTGLSAMDYRFTDARADPPGAADAHCSERLVRLPDTFLCYRPRADAPDVGPLPVSTGAPFTFGSFNNLPKLNPVVIEAWRRILRGAPRARLLIKSNPLGDQGTRAHLLAAFEDANIDPARVELVPWIHDQAAHLALYNRIDVALDPFPYNGTTTTCEALWMGVPVLTIAGDRHAARVGVSLLSQVDLQDFIVSDIDTYVEAAIALARKPERLFALRAELRGRMQTSPLRDERRFAANVESAYREMWRAWCTGP